MRLNPPGSTFVEEGGWLVLIHSSTSTALCMECMLCTMCMTCAQAVCAQYDREEK